jgi:enamine deaminase RidA (YjgF/YER057c/UK114 family)
MTGRLRVSSSGPWEDLGGYSRAVAVGDACFVSGTTDAGPDGRSLHPGDLAAQAEATLRIIEAALNEAGFSIADVVRTRTFVTDISRTAEFLAVHSRWFDAVRPAATLVQVAALIDPTLLIEIEVEVRRQPLP